MTPVCDKAVFRSSTNSACASALVSRLSYLTLLPAVVRCRGMVHWEARSSVARLWIKPNDGVAEAFYTGLWARRFNPVLGCNRDNQMIALVWPTLFQAIYP